MANNISLFSNINLFSYVFNDHFEKILMENKLAGAKSGEHRHRSDHLSHAKRALYHLS